MQCAGALPVRRRGALRRAPAQDLHHRAGSAHARVRLVPLRSAPSPSSTHRGPPLENRASPTSNMNTSRPSGSMSSVTTTCLGPPPSRCSLSCVIVVPASMGLEERRVAIRLDHSRPARSVKARWAALAFGAPLQSKSMSSVPAGPSRQYPTVIPSSVPIGVICSGVTFRRIVRLEFPAGCAASRAAANPPVPSWVPGSMSNAPASTWGVAPVLCDVERVRVLGPCTVWCGDVHVRANVASPRYPAYRQLLLRILPARPLRRRTQPWRGFEHSVRAKDRKNKASIAMVAGVSVRWSWGSMSVREQTNRGRGDAISSRQT